MKLKKVKIQGFKTFADKIEFELDGDIVAVVGPNGCGKSNIVDSILWGLGETSTKAIRAQTGKEVIFAGSVHRKPLSLAEVTLHFDNEDGALPIETPEVSVTRRVDRSGQCDYEINRRGCRLKDVADLLSDSGLGRAGYAIVGQKEIDQALSAGPQQRRGWIDEAAGIHRYRMRRHEATLRLDNAKLHLTRIEDVLRELDAQREPLANEAEVAMRYKSALNSLRQVECGLLVTEFAETVADIQSLDAQVIQAQTQAAAEAKLAEASEKESLDRSERAAKLDAESEQLRDALQSALATLERAQTTLRVAQSRLVGLDELEANLTEEGEAAQSRHDQATADLTAARDEEARDAVAYQQLQGELAGVGEEAKSLRDKLGQIESALTTARTQLAHWQRLELEQAHRDQRAADARAELAGIESALPDLASAVREAEGKFETDGRSLTALQEAIKQAQDRLADWQRQEEAQAAETRQAMAELAVLDGRRRGIEATIEAHEGLAQGSRAVLNLLKKGELQGEYTPVGDCVTVKEEFALAIDTALGAAANDLIVKDESLAKAAIQILKRDSLGRATFQPLTLVRAQPIGPELLKLASRPGVVGVASQIADAEPKYRPVLDSLLARILVVEHLDVALALSKTGGWSRCVTLDGEVLHASGSITGGRAARQTSGLVQRQSELAAATKGLKALQQKLAKAEAGAAARSEARAALEVDLAAAKTEAEPLLLELEESKSWLASLRQEQSATERSQTKLQAELGELEKPLVTDEAPVNVQNLETERDEVWKQLATRSADAESAEARLQEAFERAEASKRRLAEAERRLVGLAEAEQSRERRSNRLDPDRHEQLSAIESAELEISKGSGDAQALREKLTLVIESKRTEAEETRLATECAHKARHAATEAESRAHNAELKRARAEGKRSAALSRLIEEYGVNEDQALERAPTTVVPPDAASLVGRLRREIKEMGDVNLGAVEAYERLSERFDELNGQSQDILSGIEEIQSSVRELDRVTKQKFTETFGLVQTAFTETFRQLFGGGEGRLVLIPGEDEWNDGVEIQVTVPGKKTQRLELLSGGERAMSAIAFLFALLKVKPSPLVVLDEIDAPLDGRNVERFIGLMREFSEQIQFILVTHNSMTIESADVWFGVTMQEPGVSTLVPFKVTQKEHTKAVVPDAYLKG